MKLIFLSALTIIYSSISTVSLHLNLGCPLGYSLADDQKTCVDKDLCPIGTKLD